MTIKRLPALLAAMSAVLLVGSSVPPAGAEQSPPADAWVTVEAPPLPWEDPATAPRRTDRVLQSTIDAAVEAAKHPVRTGSPHQPPPTPPLAGALAGCTGGACFTYGRIGQDYGTDKGSGADMTITTAKPFVLSYGHSLGENSIQSDGSSTADVVEVGWIVDLAQRADGNPFLFGFFWVHGVPDTYNSAAWVDFTANPINLGAGLPKPVNKRFFHGSTSTAWWVGYDTAWVAWIPKTVFGSGPFSVGPDSVQLVQGFYEVASADDHPCHDMGTGVDSNPIVSATGSVYNLSLTGSTTPVDVFAGLVPPAGVTNNPDAFNFAKTGANAGRGSGPGYNAAGTAPGTTGAC